MTLHIAIDAICQVCDGNLLPAEKAAPGAPVNDGLAFHIPCRCQDCGRETALAGQLTPIAAPDSSPPPPAPPADYHPTPGPEPTYQQALATARARPQPNTATPAGVA